MTGPFYVQPVNLHLTSTEKAWQLWLTGDGIKAEFNDGTLAYPVADMLNMSAERVRDTVKRVAEKVAREKAAAEKAAAEAGSG